MTGSEIHLQAEELDEYYVYTHPVRISLKDREQKQVQFLDTEGVQSKKIYVYGGAANEVRASRNDANLHECKLHGSLEMYRKPPRRIITGRPDALFSADSPQHPARQHGHASHEGSASRLA